MNQIRRTLTSLAIAAAFVLVLSPIPSASADHEVAVACDGTHDIGTVSGIVTDYGAVSDGDVDIWRHYAGPFDQNFEIQTAGIGKLEITLWKSFSNSLGCFNSVTDRCTVYAGTPCMFTGVSAGDDPRVWIKIDCDDCFGTIHYRLFHFHSMTIP